MPVDVQKLKSMGLPTGLPVAFRKLGHVVLNVQDLKRSTRFYTEVLGLRFSDVYDESMTAGGMVFLRCASDHHSLALVGTGAHRPIAGISTTSRSRRPRSTSYSASATTCASTASRSSSMAGAALAARSQSSSSTPTTITSSCTGGSTKFGTDGRIRPREEWREFHSLEEAVDNPPPGQGHHAAGPDAAQAARQVDKERASSSVGLSPYLSERRRACH